ncbi:hypothetical protein [Roseibacillus ishigakijimensis]|uniref:Verru_Chthon cassette protein A n=1 Tax=Roseibacillus ishigakijimensis TaxID=454146 RepID=A0A934RNJ4_9BACT|nr:hypothetical protein [Roseibacillus ishigakijimensis]MBK1834659.1 hypothetical protein [Roseibacillus ishigakijimensis]
MENWFQRGRGRKKSSTRQGFALLVSVVILLFLSLLATGLLALSSLTLRGAHAEQDRQQARANARLALTMALGQLQVHLGPDQRVCAPSELFAGAHAVSQPHWVGVWSTRQGNGASFWQRDDRNGGLRDLRAELDWDAREEALSYLVSGNEGSRPLFEPFAAAGSPSSWVPVVSRGTLGAGPLAPGDEVVVPKVPVRSASSRAGAYAYWVGDLGVRAPVAVPNRWQGEESLFDSLLSQEVDSSLMSGGGEEPLTLRERQRLASDGQLSLLGKWGDSAWNWFDATTWSQGVLADTREGGLRKNLTAFLQDPHPAAWGKDGEIGLDDNLVGPRNGEHAQALGQPLAEGRHGTSAPTFGLLRDWARRSLPRDGGEAEVRNGETVLLPKSELGMRSAFANEEAVILRKRQQSDLKPVVVEASMYSTFSYHLNPPGFRKIYNIRSHQWPRVVLWNPYSAALSVPPSVMMMQLNSRNDFRTLVRTDNFVGDVQWISWGGGTRTPPPQVGESIRESANYNDPYTGMYYFSLPAETIGAGECLVFSPAQAMEYEGHDILANRLSARVAPDPSRNFYVSSSEFDDDDTGSGFNFELLNYFYHPASGLDNQADDSRFLWKDASGHSSLSIFDFDRLPLLASVSCSLQYGAGKEPRLALNERQRIEVEFTDLRDPVIANKPDVRSREGFRLRWLEEHPSNVFVGNNPAGPDAFETAPLANWNLRASYSLRSPWENLAGDQGDGLASGPWFFGLYTRDLYDQLVGWDEQMPFYEEGYYRGNPFGLPQEGRLRTILFELPRDDLGVLSLAQFQHAKLSEFVWHPTYAVGNSLVDPRLGLTGMKGTAPVLGEEGEGGWNALAIGWSSDAERSEDRDEWARFARFLVQDLPAEENLVYDLSYEVNHSLFDEFFLATGNERQRREFLAEGRPLPNGRLRLRPGGTAAEVGSVTRAAGALMLEGAFNVNSTRREAWKALLASLRQSALSAGEGSPFPRRLPGDSGDYLAGISHPENEEAWSGLRTLSDGEIEALADALVEQVKRRGPFLSLADFVNRRLVGPEEGELGLMGPLQAAIEEAGLNEDFVARWELRKDGELPDYLHPDNIADSTRLSQSLKPDSKAWGAPGYLTQADLLQVIAPTLSARSDSFVVRAYGEARDGEGRVTAQAWCEAIVQRTPEPLAPDSTGLNPDPGHPAGRFGRAFEVRAFRWLSADEV